MVEFAAKGASHKYNTALQLTRKEGRGPGGVTLKFGCL